MSEVNITDNDGKYRTRPIVLLRRDVAARNWDRPFDDLLAEAMSTDVADAGIVATTQNIDKSGTPLWRWWDRSSGERPREVFIAPPDWAAFYRGPTGNAQLHFQGYTESPGWMAYAEARSRKAGK